METVGDPTKGSSGTILRAACLSTIRQSGSDCQIVRVDCNAGKNVLPEQGPKAAFFCRFIRAAVDLKRPLGRSSDGE